LPQDGGWECCMWCYGPWNSVLSRYISCSWWLNDMKIMKRNEHLKHLETSWNKTRSFCQEVAPGLNMKDACTLKQWYLDCAWAACSSVENWLFPGPCEGLSYVACRQTVTHVPREGYDGQMKDTSSLKARSTWRGTDKIKKL
jgi:hypothetical protein